MAPVLMVYVGHKTTQKINYSKYVENLTDGGMWTCMDIPWVSILYSI